MTKSYSTGVSAVRVLDGISVDFHRGNFTSIMGSSGSGKSTLLHGLGGLDHPESGTVHLGRTEVTGLSQRKLTRLRRERLGFVFQAYNLLPMLTALENIVTLARIAGYRYDRAWLDTLVSSLGFDRRLDHRPDELSGGQQQRVAVARALLHRPEVILADEPTGSLDSQSGAQVLGFLRHAVDTHGQTVVMVTHDAVAASYADRVLFMHDGEIAEEFFAPTVDAVLARIRRWEA